MLGFAVKTAFFRKTIDSLPPEEGEQPDVLRSPPWPSGLFGEPIVSLLHNGSVELDAVSAPLEGAVAGWWNTRPAPSR